MAKNISKQECIPVGCVPSAAVAACLGGGSASMHAGIHPPPGPGPPPPGPGPGDSPARPPNLPPGMDLETPPPDPQSPPGYGPGDPHPMNRMTDTCKNITFATCNRCKNITSPALIDILNDIFQNKRSQSSPFICVVSSCPPCLHYILRTHSLRCLCH